jgi:hypothetical protein
MSRTAELEARAAALSTKPGPAKPPAPRARPVKMTVDLAPDLWRVLKDYPEQMHLPDATGLARVPAVEVVRALIRELEQSPELREAVAQRVREAVKK